MSYHYQIEITVMTGKDLKNVNWRYGKLKPYAIVWLDPSNKLTTSVDDDSDVFPFWAQKLIFPLYAPIEDSTVHMEVVHANADGTDVKPFVGSARLPLRDVVDDVGLGECAIRELVLKRPSGRPHGVVNIIVAVRDLRYYSSREAPYTNPYSAPPPPNPYQAAPPAGYPYGQVQPAYGQSQPAYGQSRAYGQSTAYGQPQPTYGKPAYGKRSYGQLAQPVYGEEKKRKVGEMGTGLSVRAAVEGVLGGLALVEGAVKMEDDGDESDDSQ